MAVRLIPEYIVLILLLGAARAWLFPHVGPEIGNELGWIVALRGRGDVVRHSDGGRGADHSGHVVAWHGRGARWRATDDAAADQRAVAGDAGRAFRPRLLTVVAVGMVAIGVVGGLAAVALHL